MTSLEQARAELRRWLLGEPHDVETASEAHRIYTAACEELQEDAASYKAAADAFKHDLSAAQARIAELTAERDEIQTALTNLLLARDASWTGGHNWQQALDAALLVALSSPAAAGVGEKGGVN